MRPDKQTTSYTNTVKSNSGIGLNNTELPACIVPKPCFSLQTDLLEFSDDEQFSESILGYGNKLFNSDEEKLKANSLIPHKPELADVNQYTTDVRQTLTTNAIKTNNCIHNNIDAVNNTKSVDQKTSTILKTNQAVISSSNNKVNSTSSAYVTSVGKNSSPGDQVSLKDSLPNDQVSVYYLFIVFCN